MDVSKLYDKAKSAVERRNYDYAIELFQQLLTLDPNNVESREILRATELRRIQEQGGSAAMAYLKGMGSLIGMIVNKLSKNWEKVMVNAEKFLVNDPNNMTALNMLGDAAAHAEYFDTAVCVFENIAKNKVGHVPTLFKLADLHRVMQDYKKAQSYYDVILKHRPHDKDASRWSKQLAAQVTMDAGGWNKANDFHDIIKDKDAASKMEQRQHIARSEDEIEKALALAEEQIAEKPDDMKLYIEKGDLLRRLHRYPEAVAVFQSILARDKAHFTAMARLGDTMIEQLNNKIVAARKKLQANPQDAAAKEEVKQATIAKIRKAVEEYIKRVKMHPTDLELKYQLGYWLFTGGKSKEAASEFQQSLRDPKRRSKAQQYLGLCFMKMGRLNLAIEQLEKALASYPLMNDEAKEVAYYLGDAYSKIAKNTSNADEKKESMKKSEATFKKVFEVDINYKDVSERMEKISQALNNLS